MLAAALVGEAQTHERSLLQMRISDAVDRNTPPAGRTVGSRGIATVPIAAVHVLATLEQRRRRYRARQDTSVPMREEGPTMATSEKSIDVHAPVRTVYNQWTQFEECPRFMEGVREVRQL
jgi:hypothetical protein